MLNLFCLCDSKLPVAVYSLHVIYKLPAAVYSLPVYSLPVTVYKLTAAVYSLHVTVYKLPTAVCVQSAIILLVTDLASGVLSMKC